MELTVIDKARIITTRQSKIGQVVIGLSFLLLFVSLIFGYQIKFLSYVDEILCLIYGVALVIGVIKKRFSLIKEDKTVVFLLALTIFLGLISNLINALAHSLFWILLDLLGFVKVFVAYLFFKYFFSKSTLLFFINKWSGVAKILISISFICAIISLFYDIGMRGQYRYGLYGFNFVFSYAHEFEVFLICCISVILISNTRNKLLYLFFMVLLLALSLKGPSFVLAVTLPFLFFYFKKFKHIHLIYFVVPLVIILLLSSYQIQTYFLDTDSARSTLIRFGFITGINYFPLGSGFSTYGTYTAFSDYSTLYYQYGFDQLNGLNPYDGSFLNDNYFPMIVAQFGLFGLLNMLFLFFTFFQQSYKNHTSAGKAVLLSILLFALVHSLGSALLTSSAGFLLFSVLGVIDKATIERKNSL
ncbi:MAG: hypothetical protein LKJ88_02925 [Bacilli bacterium]|jgi:hypothetical protein|nr:hypothetical protein [Bacilli bacterium]